MNRRTVFLMALAGATSGCMRPRQRRLNVMNWGDYIGATTIRDFENETGIKVRYATYENNEELLGKVMSGNSGWDIIFPTHNRVFPLRQLGLLAPLRQKLLPGLKNLFPRFQQPPWDPSLEWCVPYMWTTTGIAYNRAKYPSTPVSWNDLWDERARGHLLILDDVDDVFGAALAKLGFPYYSANPDELRKAQREVIAQKRLVRAYLSTEGRDQMVAGDVLIAQTFATTAQLAIDGNRDIAYTIPREPFPVYCDCGVILKESRRYELAHEFLNFTLRPAVSAAIARTIRTATPNQQAFSLLPAAEQANITLYPTAETLERAEWPLSLPADIVKLRDRLWTEVKSA
jgi:spermidine/putrescine transport system substrate-binding protein